MAGFVDGAKDFWSKVSYPFRSDGMAEDIVESDIFPFARFEELAAIPDAHMTEEEKGEFESLRPQIEKAGEGVSGLAGVVAERTTDEAIGFADEIGDGVGRGIEKKIMEETKMGKVLGWLQENWKLVLSGVLGVVGAVTGGFMGGVAKIGAVLIAANDITERVTGTSLLEMGTDFFSKNKNDAPGEKVTAIARSVPEKSLVAVEGELSMEQLAAASGINHRTDWAQRQAEPKVKSGYLEGLVSGAQKISGIDGAHKC